MVEKINIEETLDSVESKIKHVTKLVRQLTPGNVSHVSGNIICILEVITNLYLPKIKKSLEKHE